jgi:hypothetical protein
MKQILSLMALAVLAFGVWYFFSSGSRLLGRLKEDSILLPHAQAKVHSSSNMFRVAEHILECRWEDVAVGKPGSQVRATMYSRDQALRNPEVRELMKKVAPFAFGEFSWPGAQIYAGDGASFLSEFLLVHFVDHRVLIWYNVR